QVIDALKPELHEEGLGRSVCHRSARRLFAAADLYPANFHQDIDCALRQRHAAYVLNLGAGDWLVISDDGEGFDRRARKPTLLGLFLAKEKGQVWRRAELPFFCDPHESYAPILIDPLKS